MKNQFKISTLTNISDNYRCSYYIKNEESYYPWISLMMSFSPKEYLKHYQNVSYKFIKSNIIMQSKFDILINEIKLKFLSEFPINYIQR